jgi:hypothetical protein
MRDEAVAFAAWGYDFVQNHLHDIDTLLNRLENRLGKVTDRAEQTPLIILRPFESGEMAYIFYWTSAGAMANALPSYQQVQVMDAKNLDKDTVYLVSRTVGGRDPLSQEETIAAYRATLQSRERLSTFGDIRAACSARLGGLIREVRVKHGVRTGRGSKTGLIRSLEVFLQPAKEARFNDMLDWKSSMQDLEVHLNRQASGLAPIYVQLEKEEVS